jgi:hypothetical protein
MEQDDFEPAEGLSRWTRLPSGDISADFVYDVIKVLCATS